MSSPAIRIVGSFMSPYVRKVLVCLEIKGLRYEVDPIVPFYGNDEFSKLSPLRRIPVLIDDAVTLCDSTVICEYLDERYPSPSLLPHGAARRAQARWLEEYADTRMGDVLIWRYYAQLVVRPFVWGEKPDEEIVRRSRDEEIPGVLDYLEAQAPKEGFLFGGVTVADVAIASFFRSAGFAKYEIDAQRWPRTAALVARTLALPAFQKLKRYEDVMLGTPVRERRGRLREVGAPLTPETMGADVPRRGIMPI
jgi:glutathione S-transferase